MITIRNWIPIIPEEDKHVAYVGEGESVRRQFRMDSDGWQTYRDWTFYLDMAFDLSSVTTRDSRQVVTTQEDVTENVAETQVKTTATEKKETYTVDTVTVDAPARTDVALLRKHEDLQGILLTWFVLAQHTQLPGKLTATLRAVGPNGEVKKSALMVFEVDPAVEATPAAVVPQSVHEQMLNEMSVYYQQGYTQAQTATGQAEAAAASAANAQTAAQQAQDEAHRAQDFADAVDVKAAQVVKNADMAADSQLRADSFAAAAEAAAARAAESELKAEEYTTLAYVAVNQAIDARDQAQALVSELQENALLPSVTAADNGKLLQVVSGAWAAVAISNGNEVAY